jgi:hypothetical protein
LPNFHRLSIIARFSNLKAEGGKELNEQLAIVPIVIGNQEAKLRLIGF